MAHRKLEIMNLGIGARVVYFFDLFVLIQKIGSVI